MGVGGMALSSSRAMAGEEGAFMISWHDGSQWRFAVGVVGEAGIEARIWYEVRDGVLVEWDTEDNPP